EAATLASVVGSVVVVGGLAMTGLGGRPAGATAGGSGDGRARRAVGWAVACAIAIAGYHLAYGAALKEAVNPSACFALSLAVAVTINATRLSRAGRGRFVELMRQRWRRLVVMGVVSSGSFLALMEALARGGAWHVLTLRNTSVLFALVLG